MKNGKPSLGLRILIGVFVALPMLLALILGALGKDAELSYAEVCAEKDHPCISVTTHSGQAVVSRDSYVPAVVDVFNCADEYRLTAAPCGMKVRGNYTSRDENEKPYRIQFRSEQNLLGLHGGNAYKSWVLLRVFSKLAMDYMGFELGRTIFDGRYYCSDCTYVNLYLNGAYKGVYLLCEQNQAAPGRIDLYEPQEGETQTQIGYLLELDCYAKYDVQPYFYLNKKPEVTDVTGVSRTIRGKYYSIKSDIRSEEQTEFIRRHISGVFDILYEAAVTGKPWMLDERQKAVPAEGVYATGFDAVAAVIDLDSLADMLILGELVQDEDIGVGSFYMAVDFSPEAVYPRLTFLGPWDFEGAYRKNPETNYYAAAFQEFIGETDGSNGWFVLAMKLDGFQEIVKEKWRALSESGVLNETVDRVVSECETLENDLGDSAGRIEYAREVADFVRKRIIWLDSQWL